MEILYRAILVYLWCAFASNRIFFPIGSMNTRRNEDQRLGEEIFNAGASPRVEKVPSLEEDANVEQASVNPPPLRNENIRTALLQMSQSITSQAQPSTT